MPKKATDKDSERIVKLKESGKTWAEISDAVSLPQGTCMFLYEEATVTPATKITAKNEEDLRKKIAKARSDGMSWGKIAARSGKSEGYCKKAYEDITGKSARGDRIGKGGRFPSGAERPAKAAGAVKKATGPRKATGAVKKATGKKVAAKKVAGKKVAAKKAAKKATASAE